jgi:hypothetical protein
VDRPRPGLAHRIVGGCTDVVVQPQGLERCTSQVSQYQRLAPITGKPRDRALGLFGRRHLEAASDVPPALMDDALREGNLDGACGVAGAECAGAARIWIVKAVDPCRPVRLSGRTPAQAHERRDFDPGRPTQILERAAIRQPKRDPKRLAGAPMSQPGAPPWPMKPPPPMRRQRSFLPGRRARAARTSVSR